MLKLRCDVAGYGRGLLFRSLGGKVGRGTTLPKVQWTWPHQVVIGEGCVLQPGIFFNYDHYWTPGPSIMIGNRVFVGKDCEFNIRCKLEIGDDSLVAAGCTFVDHDHGRLPGIPMNRQESIDAPIIIGKNVWIGAKCVILKGVSIGDDAVVGAGAVVTKSIPGGEVWAGCPARRIAIGETPGS